MFGSHFYGGDHVMDGNVDNPVRHAVSKLSSFHFVSMVEHSQRLISLGENPKNIFNLGSMDLDKFKNYVPMSNDSLRDALKIKKTFTNYCLVIFHPLGKESKSPDSVFLNILKAIEYMKLEVVVNYPNTDPGNQKIINIIDKYQKKQGFYFF